MKTKTKYGTINDSDGVYTGQYFVKNVCPDDKVIKKTIKSGKGTMKYVNGDFYDGNWMDDTKTGKGIMKYANGDVYDGKWSSNGKYGKGIMRYANGDIYEGEWFVDMIYGIGLMRYNNGNVYNGKFIPVKSLNTDRYLRSIKEGVNGYPRYEDGTSRDNNGKVIHIKLSPGVGTMAYANGDFYSGEWINDLRHGKGTMSYANGDIYVGEWEKNVRHGYGTMSYKNGVIYEGEWLNNSKKHTKGKKNVSKRKKSSNSKTKSKKDKIITPFLN